MLSLKKLHLVYKGKAANTRKIDFYVENVWENFDS